MNNRRYEGKPLLRLLECYVLKAIDKLPLKDADGLKAMQPKLAKLYGVTDTWDQIIASTMEFPENMPALIRETWKKNQEIAAANKVTLTAQQFAEMFVDQSFG